MKVAMLRFLRNMATFIVEVLNPLGAEHGRMCIFVRAPQRVRMFYATWVAGLWKVGVCNTFGVLQDMAALKRSGLDTYRGELTQEQAEELADEALVQGALSGEYVRLVLGQAQFHTEEGMLWSHTMPQLTAGTAFLEEHFDENKNAHDEVLEGMEIHQAGHR